MSSPAPQQLFQTLFPGQQYSDEWAPELAAKLRALADEIQEQSGSAAAQPGAGEAEDKGVQGMPTGAGHSNKRRKKGGQEGGPKDLDFDAYHSRYVALELLYLGGSYQGFATQLDTEETIEGHLFRALRKTRLIRPSASWQELQYSRGGRTDKGVSAVGQVVALTLRSCVKSTQPLPEPEAEIDYPTVINRALPEDIRITGWTPVPQDFSARFSAAFREYKYYFVQQPGAELDLGAMAQAAAHFVGEHDFRNFCKAGRVDAAHVNSFQRTILDFRIQRVEGCGWGGRQLYELYIRGTAFLWHQVRCMAAVLFMVGRGEEEPSVVAALLDTAAQPRKPQYCLASEAPLLLYSCSYTDLHFRRSQGNHGSVHSVLSEMLNRHLIAAGMLTALLGRLGSSTTHEEQAPTSGPTKRGKGCSSGIKHIKLLKRATEPSLEARLAKHGKRLAAPGPGAQQQALAAAAAANGAGEGCGDMVE
ncbi:hypothetical protein N2152v2_008217 [Parachlorella kessleri]